MESLPLFLDDDVGDSSARLNDVARDCGYHRAPADGESVRDRRRQELRESERWRWGWRVGSG